MPFCKLKNWVTSDEFKNILKFWTIELNNFIIWYTRRVQEQVAQIYWNKDELLVRKSFPISNEIIDMAKTNFIKDFFSNITEKFRKMKFYDEETLFKSLQIMLNRYINGRYNEKRGYKINIESASIDNIVKINIFKLTDTWLVDMINYEWENNRKNYTKLDKENSGEGVFIPLLWNKWKKRNKVKLWNYQEFQKITENSWALIINRIDWTKFIINFELLDNFQGEILSIIWHDLIEVIKEKLNEVIYRYTDRITKCRNSAYFNEISENTTYSVFAIDLNNFKYFNDTYWHTEWDKVLSVFWEKLKSCIRENEWVVIRMSWDEFSIVVNLSGKDDLSIVKKIEERINKKINEWFFCVDMTDMNWEKQIHEIWFSIWTFYNEKKDTSVSSAYKNADMLMIDWKSEEWYLYRIIKLFSKYSKDEQENWLINLWRKLWFNITIRKK